MLGNAPVVKVIGQGKIGLKSQGLIDSKPAFQKANSPFPDIFPIISSYFGDFYGRAKVGKDTDENTAKKNIDNTPFTKNEMEGILDVALPYFIFSSSFSYRDFCKLYAAIARSDEWAAGTGIRKTEEALSYGDEAVFIERLFIAIKEVLASGFTKDAKIFDRMMGVGEEANGAMLMPYYGSRYFLEKMAAVFPLFLSVAYAGKGAKKTSIYSLVGDGTLGQWNLYSPQGLFDLVCNNVIDYHLHMPHLLQLQKCMHGASTLDGYTFTLDTVLSDSVPEN
ncbi:MAG: hypothetical protein WC861_07335, partial [Candidatus Micrarchaeia archaeon]